MSYGADFINALNAGLNTGDTMRRRNALMGAGRMAAGGDAKGGMNALLGAGMIEEAGQFRQIGEQQRQGANRERVRTAMSGAGNDWRAQLQAGFSAAEDPDEKMRFQQAIAQMDDQQRQRWAATNDAFGALSVGLVSSKVPPEQRMQRALAMAPQIAQQTGLDVGQVTQMIQSTQDWSDQSLLSIARQNMGAADAVQEYTRQAERGEELGIEERRYQQQRQDRLRASSGPSLPSLSPGYRWVPGKEGIEAMPIPGGPQDQRVNEAGQKVRRSMETQMRNRTNVLRALDDAERMIAWDSTGAVGQVLGGIGGTKAHDLRAVVDTVTGNIGFEALQEMRMNSPTGGALGQVAVREIELLQRTVANLENSQSERQFRQNLRAVREQYNASMQNLYQAYVQDFGQAPPEGAIGGAAQGGGQRRRFNPETGRIE